MSRNTATLDKLAAMTKGKSDGRSGSGAKNTNKFVFASVSPAKPAAESTAAAADSEEATETRDARRLPDQGWILSPA